MRFIKYFCDNIINLNIYNNFIIDFYEGKEIKYKKYKRLNTILNKILKKIKFRKLFNVYFDSLKIDIYKLNKKRKKYKIIKNYLIDKYIYNDFKSYFPLKDYLINNNFIDFHKPKFDDDDMFYYLLLSLLKIDSKVFNFLNSLND